MAELASNLSLVDTRAHAQQDSLEQTAKLVCTMMVFPECINAISYGLKRFILYIVIYWQNPTRVDPTRVEMAAVASTQRTWRLTAAYVLADLVEQTAKLVRNYSI